MRLIDVDETLRKMQEVLDEKQDQKDSVAYFAFSSVMSALQTEPTVDAVVFPCKVGDAVYMEIGDDETPHFVDAGEVFAICIDENGIVWISVRYECGLKYYHPSDDIGKTVFLTRKEAEAALAKMDGE